MAMPEPMGGFFAYAPFHEENEPPATPLERFSLRHSHRHAVNAKTPQTRPYFSLLYEWCAEFFNMQSNRPHSSLISVNCQSTPSIVRKDGSHAAAAHAFDNAIFEIKVEVDDAGDDAHEAVEEDGANAFAATHCQESHGTTPTLSSNTLVIVNSYGTDEAIHDEVVHKDLEGAYDRAADEYAGSTLALPFPQTHEADATKRATYHAASLSSCLPKQGAAKNAPTAAPEPKLATYAEIAAAIDALTGADVANATHDEDDHDYDDEIFEVAAKAVNPNKRYPLAAKEAIAEIEVIEDVAKEPRHQNLFPITEFLSLRGEFVCQAREMSMLKTKPRVKMKKRRIKHEACVMKKKAKTRAFEAKHIIDPG